MPPLELILPEDVILLWTSILVAKYAFVSILSPSSTPKVITLLLKVETPLIVIPPPNKFPLALTLPATYKGVPLGFVVLEDKPVPNEAVLDAILPLGPSTIKVPDIAAEPVNGKGVAVTPDNPEPSPVKEPVKEPVILEPATVEVLVKVPIEMSGVCTKPAATVEKEAEEASSAFVACEEVPVTAPANEPVKEPVILEPATVEVLAKVPTEMSGVCTKPAATVAKEALIASVALLAHEEVPVRAPTKEPVKEPVSWVLAIVSSLFTIEPDTPIDPVD